MAKEYEVIRINELTRVSDTRGLVKYYRHQIRTRGGTILTVDIDEDDWTEEGAIPILRAKAVAADKIKSL